VLAVVANQGYDDKISLAALEGVHRTCTRTRARRGTKAFQMRQRAPSAVLDRTQQPVGLTLIW
jgi:hypothetical protein